MYGSQQLAYAPTPYSYTPSSNLAATINLDQEVSKRFRIGTNLNLSRTNNNGSVRSERGSGTTGPRECAPGCRGTPRSLANRWDIQFMHSPHARSHHIIPPGRAQPLRWANLVTHVSLRHVPENCR